MTKSLGQLGNPNRPPVDLSFEWFGATIRVAPDASDLYLIEFMVVAATIDTADKAGAMLATREFLASQIHPDDIAEFMRLAKGNRQQFEDLLEVGKAIVQEVARFPTGRPSGSTAGRSTTPPRLTDAYSSSVEVALAELEGRPDLQSVIWLQYQARTAALAN